MPATRGRDSPRQIIFQTSQENSAPIAEPQRTGARTAASPPRHDPTRHARRGRDRMPATRAHRPSRRQAGVRRSPRCAGVWSARATCARPGVTARGVSATRRLCAMRCYSEPRRRGYRPPALWREAAVDGRGMARPPAPWCRQAGGATAWPEPPGSAALCRCRPAHRVVWAL